MWVRQSPRGEGEQNTSFLKGLPEGCGRRRLGDKTRTRPATRTFRIRLRRLNSGQTPSEKTGAVSAQATAQPQPKPVLTSGSLPSVAERLKQVRALRSFLAG